MVSAAKRCGKTKGAGLETAIGRINSNAAGIDIGSQRHYVSVGGENANSCVRSFGCYTPDLEDMAKWRLECGITTVAMESTGFRSTLCSPSTA